MNTGDGEKNTQNRMNVDLCIIGAGSGGLSIAAGAVQMGASVVLIERDKMGGDCLNTGCVPSKALLAAGKAAQKMRDSGKYGVTAQEPEIDFKAAHDHVHGVIDGIAPHDSVERFEGLGVHVITEHGEFISPREVQAGNTIVRARRFIIATGSRAFVPPIPGIDSVPHFTNENIFENTELPRHLIVIGGGPIGLEMAQAHRRLGSEVTVLEKFSALPKDDPELAKVVLDQMRADGVNILEGVDIERIEQDGEDIAIPVTQDGESQRIVGSHLLVATGRRPNVDGLGLEEAGVEYAPQGVKVDARLRTSNKRIFAVGDAKGGLMFTHVAGYDAGIVIRNALFRMPAKADYTAIPWVTYTDPELANVGLTEEQAREKFGNAVTAITFPFAEIDRARAERTPDGMIKAVMGKGGKILGCAIVGHEAGELIHPWTLAISQGMKIGAMAGAVAAYPTRSEISKRVAGQYYVPSLFSDRTKKIVKLLAKLG